MIPLTNLSTLYHEYILIFTQTQSQTFSIQLGTEEHAICGRTQIHAAV